jgi:NADH-quinone oxidoreductase subunit J
MTDALFWTFSVLMLASGLVVIAGRNPIHCTMALVFSLFCMAGLFVLLEAYFLAAVQVLVYAGAVMVLFLFVIMLLDLKAEARRKLRIMSTILGGAVAAGFAWEFFCVLKKSPLPGPASHVATGTVENVGKALFTDSLIPFEVTSLLLLVAMIGAVLLSRKELK